MKADLTRNTFYSLKHFRRVLMQQGRVQLDADWNEQASILLHHLQSLAADVIGPEGGTPNAFKISPINNANGSLKNDFQIGLGDYYVNGILCEADSGPVPVAFESDISGQNATISADSLTLDGTQFQENQFVDLFDDTPFSSGSLPSFVAQITNVNSNSRQLKLWGPFDQTVPGSSPPAKWVEVIKKFANPALRRVITYLTQSDYPNPEPLPDKTGLVYLDVWERHITYIEDDSIREVALGGPDTATRSRLVWQVKVAPGKVNSATSPCDNFVPDDTALLAILSGARRGRLKAMAKQKSTSTDPCIIPPDANFRGAENQLYRVEVHRSGPAWDGKDENTKKTAATFKWSRENGSVVFPVVSIASGNGTTTVVLENLGRDDRFGLSKDDWVELLNDVYVLKNTAAPLLQVQAINSGSLTVTLKGTADPSLGKPGTHPLLRRWDQKAGDSAEGGLILGDDNAALIEESSKNWLALEEGVQIQFQPPLKGRQPNQYLTGDYWLIPARTATGDVEWPTETTMSGSTTTTTPIAQPPHGVQHCYAPLAVISATATGLQVMAPECRKVIKPLAAKP